MALEDMRWKPVTVHDIVAEYLLGEREKFRFPPGKVIDAPNVNDPQENHQRLRILYKIRVPFFVEIPPDTQWYEVDRLTDRELDELHVVRCKLEWNGDGTDKNELHKVAARSPETLTEQPVNWRRPILWGHEKSGPFTIIEGNHRLIAYASTTPPPGLAIPVFIGLSPTPCFWHNHDPIRFIAQDLWK